MAAWKGPGGGGEIPGMNQEDVLLSNYNTLRRLYLILEMLVFSTLLSKKIHHDLL